MTTLFGPSPSPSSLPASVVIPQQCQSNSLSKSDQKNLKRLNEDDVQEEEQGNTHKKNKLKLEINNQDEVTENAIVTNNSQELGRIADLGSSTFESLGLCDWVCRSCKAMGFRRPTPIQSACIQAILNGKDVMGCAETGSGKTAAFALPILQTLSVDPYGIYAVILTPTRELAIQIQEQVVALGSSVGVKTALIIGGNNIVGQSLALSKKPHIVIATPGRLRHHLLSASPPDLRKAQYLVLDEADRLMSSGFEAELLQTLKCMSNPRRQTLLFSATLTSSLTEIEKLAKTDTLKFDLTSNQLIPATLVEQYMFIPSQVKICYLVSILKNMIAQSAASEEDEIARNKSKKHKRSKTEEKDDKIPTLKTSIIIFVRSCKRCQLICELLLELGIDCVALHSALSQNRRSASLGKFKNQVTKILVATDIASRGLDIPQVDLVINLDLPLLAIDYVHRVGRTARAGRLGRSLSLVIPNEVGLVHDIEKYTKRQMTESKEATENDVIPLLNAVAKAMKSAQLRLMEVGFDEQIEKRAKRKVEHRQKKSLRSNATNDD